MATGEKNHDPAPELVAYALTWSFSHASHQWGHDSSPPIAVYTYILLLHAHIWRMNTQSCNGPTVCTYALAYVHVKRLSDSSNPDLLCLWEQTLMYALHQMMHLTVLWRVLGMHSFAYTHFHRVLQTLGHALEWVTPLVPAEEGRGSLDGKVWELLSSVSHIPRLLMWPHIYL